MNVIRRIGLAGVLSCSFSASEAVAQAKVKVDSDQLDFTELSLEDH